MVECKVKRKPIMSNCCPEFYRKPSIQGIEPVFVSEYICEVHCTPEGLLMNLVTCDKMGDFYLYDCLAKLIKKVSKAGSPLKLKGRRL